MIAKLGSPRSQSGQTSARRQTAKPDELAAAEPTEMAGALRQLSRDPEFLVEHNASYYRLLPDQKRYYINDTGTGNTVNLSHRRVLQLVAEFPSLQGNRDEGRRLSFRSRDHPGERAVRLR